MIWFVLFKYQLPFHTNHLITLIYFYFFLLSLLTDIVIFTWKQSAFFYYYFFLTLCPLARFESLHFISAYYSKQTNVYYKFISKVKLLTWFNFSLKVYCIC